MDELAPSLVFGAPRSRPDALRRAATVMPVFFVFIFLVLLTTTGCAYRFTNTNVVRPEGIQTIAVEAVYDTSREVLSHEILWDELQAAFIADGHLRVVPRQNADAIVRTHIKQAQISPRGSIDTIDKDDEDPVIEGDDLPSVDSFRRLTQAGEIRDTSQLSMVVDVEVVSLRTKDVLLRRSYPFTKAFLAVHALAAPGKVDKKAVTTVTNDYLRYEEAVDAKTRLIAQELSRLVVKDLLVR